MHPHKISSHPSSNRILRTPSIMLTYTTIRVFTLSCILLHLLAPVLPFTVVTSSKLCATRNGSPLTHGPQHLRFRKGLSYLSAAARLKDVRELRTRIDCARVDSAGNEGDISNVEVVDGDSDTLTAGNLLQTLTGGQFSVALGVGLLLAVLTNRIFTPELVDSQARTDILGVIASGGLVTNGVYLLDLNVKEAEEVTLVGTFIQEYDSNLTPSAQQDLRWLGESLLLASAATSMLFYLDGRTLARVGVMGESPAVRDAPILRKCLRDGRDGREQYLAALQTLPGKIEFDYLPENCQAVLMLPILDSSGVVVIGTNRARAFTPKDIAWMKGLCDQAASSLQGVSAL